MAAIQIQRTRNAPNITKTAINQKQSLEIVQTMLHGSLSTLAYLRNLFAEKTFDTQVYDMAQKLHSYKDYAAGNLTRKASEANPPHTVMRILRRGRSRRADKFLDWLEKGAFVAIKAGHLHALQVYVHGDPDDRSKVLETYTFTFKYNVTDANQADVTGFELDKPGSPLISIQATNTAFQSMVRELMKMCPMMPELPAQRYVSMELFYTPGISQQYKPRDFVPSTIETLALPGAEDWERETMALTPLDACFHGSTMKIMTLVDPTAKEYTEPPVTHYPESVQYSTIMPKTATLGLLPGPECNDESLRICRSGSETVTPSTIVTELNKQRQPIAGDMVANAKPVPAAAVSAYAEPAMVVVDPQGTPGRSHSASEANTARKRSHRPSIHATAMTFIAGKIGSQSSNIVGMQHAFRDMMHPEQISQGETQILSQMTQPHAQSDLNTRFGHLTGSSSKAALSKTAKHDALMLSPSKATSLKQGQRQLEKQAVEMIKRGGRRNLKGDLVLCQCGHDKEEDDMVQCSYCKTWQHLPCYGFTGVNDPRLPEEHTCYQCLLDKDEQGTLVRLQELALKRRVMDYAVQHGLRSQKQLVDDLELQQGQARTVMNFLKDAGYVVEASGAHKTGYAATGKPSLVAVTSGPDHQDMLQTLFDPLALIAHHYKLPARPMTQLNLTQHLLASQAPDMPPPATPALHLRKGVSATPGSGLDIRASMAPYETPSHPRGYDLPPRKRSADTDDGGSNLFKRFKSMQTKCVLDANGLTSSPALYTSDQ